jgi:hypothetical protein
MLRTARLTVLFNVCATALLLNLISAVGQAQEGHLDAELRPLVGAPFSGVGTQQTIRRTLDGNSFVHTNTTRYYRDGQGRLRVEHEFDVPPGLDPNIARARQHGVVTIDDRVSGDFYFVEPSTKTAHVVKRAAAAGAANSGEPTASAPPLITVFEGMLIGPNERGWSAPVSLGEKSIDGINAIGARRVYTIAAGTMRNEKPVTITVEQWFSPAFGAILMKSAKASTGGESLFRLEQIVQAEPDASLFTVPADYKLTTLPSPGTTNTGVVISATSTATAEATSK